MRWKGEVKVGALMIAISEVRLSFVECGPSSTNEEEALRSIISKNGKKRRILCNLVDNNDFLL